MEQELHGAVRFLNSVVLNHCTRMFEVVEPFGERRGSGGARGVGN